MEAYAAVLNYAIPGFVILILLEFGIGALMGIKTIRSMDTISSLSSGMTNILKDVLGLTVIIFSYGWMEKRVALFDLPDGWWIYLIAFIGLDFAGYWQHRFSHRINLLWNEHIIHHSSEEFNLSCALRQTISKIFAIYTILLLPCALLGVPPIVIAIVAPLHLFAQFWYHTRLIGKMGFLEYIIVTPSHHRVHHAINKEYLDKNFSQIFIIWDMLFGTFQKELDDVPCVYGVKRPVSTWNPILINFQHLWLLAKDAWRARSWWDKLRIWFMPTGWRPADVAEKYPVEVVEDVSKLKKYAPPASVPLTIWSWFQLTFNLGLMLVLFNTLGKLEFWQMLAYAGFIFGSVFSYTSLMDRSLAGVVAALLTSIGGFALFYVLDGWFFMGDWFPAGEVIIVTYLVVNPLVALAFTLVEFRQDRSRSMAPAA